MAKAKRPAIGRSSRTPAAIINTTSKGCETMPVNNRLHAKSSNESQPREFLYQSARKTRAKRRNSKPSANSGLGRMVAGEALKIVSIFPVVETAAPVWFMAGGNPAAPRQYMAATDATPARADT